MCLLVIVNDKSCCSNFGIPNFKMNCHIFDQEYCELALLVDPSGSLITVLSEENEGKLIA